MEVVQKKTRRSKLKTETAEAMRKQLERIQQEAEQELEAEKRLLEETEKKIQAICDEEELFCGIILTPEDLINVIRMAIEVKSNIKIPFKLYFNE